MIKIKLVKREDVNEFRELEAWCFGMKTCKEMNYLMIPMINYGWSFKLITMTGKIIGGIITFNTIGGYCYINSLFVDKRYRNRGYARKLMKHLMEYASGYGLILEVDAKNKRLIKFYKKLGFKKYNTVKNYFLDGDTKDIMICKVSVKAGGKAS